MNFTYPVEEYLNQLKAYKELEKPVFPPDASDEEILRALEARSKKKREIADKVNLMIAEYVETFEKSPELLTEEDAGCLRAFFDELMPKNDPLGLDSATALRLAVILHDHCRRTGDAEGYIFTLKKCCVLYLNFFAYHGIRAYTVSPYRDECFELAKSTEGLSQESKENVLNALSGSVFVQNDIDFDVIWKADDLILSALGDVEKLNDREDRIVFVEFFNAMHMFCRDVELKAAAGIREIDVPDRERLTRMYNYGREHFEKGLVYEFDPYMQGSILIRTGFLLGEYGIQKFLDDMDELQAKGENNPDPSASLFYVSHLNTLYINYLRWFSGKPKEEIHSIIEERVYKRMPRMLSTTRAIESSRLNIYFMPFLQCASAVGNFEDFEKIALEMTVYADKALYIHTEMVREISLAIFDNLIEKSPEVFDGVAGRDTEWIRSHKEELRGLLSKCCMFHDIGKFYMLDIVENSMRRLTDYEFNIIKSHPANFDEIFPLEKVVTDENLRCIRDCALSHHTWHDGTRGYPVTEQTKNRPFVDILAIADGLDAATDVYGRPYRRCKTLDELIAEFQTGAGDHYGREAAAALSDPEVYDKLQYLITEGRKKIYCRIYREKKKKER
ncbi:MAG: hypothetical protein IK064_02985 [Clostridia bacterium]|nr:hypothetical protein [Clostridia bacterium]